MNPTFSSLEQAIAHVEQRFPGAPKQEVILTRLYYHIMPKLNGHLNDGLKSFGINQTIWMALLALYSCPLKALYPSDISDTLDSSRTNATRIADELVKNGWATRLPCPDDRRKILLELTDAGNEFVEKVLPVSRESHKALWRDFSDEEKRVLEKMLRTMLTRLET